jgi:transcriptional regulator with XRE-family HTH domain
MKNLRMLRKAAGLMSQAELAHRTGIERSRLSNAENGYVELSQDEQARIIKVIAKAVKGNQERARSLLRAPEDQTLIPTSA